jgi:hypothetical protein
MTQQIYIVIDGDSFEVEVDTSDLTVKSIWRYANNEPSKPKYVNPAWLDQNQNYRTLKHEIDSRMFKMYGEPSS